MHQISRYFAGLVRILAIALVLSLTPLATTTDSPANAAVTKLSNGADISWLPQIEREGSAFRDSRGRVTEPLRIMKQAGLSAVRVRLWVNPPKGQSDLADALMLAKRAKSANLQFILDLHFSDTWADPGHQTPPDAWGGLSCQGLEEKIFDYSHDTLSEFTSLGLSPTWVQLGNEIANGMLWPCGKLQKWDSAEFGTLSRLLNAASSGVSQASPKSKTLIHLETGGDSTKTRNWLSLALANGLKRPDAVGLSYYSQWGGPLTNLKESLLVVAKEFSLPVVVAETAYPNTAATQVSSFLDAKTARLPGFALSSAGQAAYAREVSSVLRSAAGSRAIGVWWWEGFSPNKSKVSNTFGPSLLFNSSLVDGSGRPNAAMLALGASSTR